jgi:hypothetical protein
MIMCAIQDRAGSSQCNVAIPAFRFCNQVKPRCQDKYVAVFVYVQDFLNHMLKMLLKLFGIGTWGPGYVISVLPRTARFFVGHNKSLELAPPI